MAALGLVEGKNGLLEGIAPIGFVCLRVGIGALVVLIFYIVQRRTLLGKNWNHFLVLGLLLNAIPFTLISYGARYIPSGLAAILNGTTPWFVILFAAFFESARAEKSTA